MNIGLILERENFSEKQKQEIFSKHPSVVAVTTRDVVSISDFIISSYGKSIDAITIYLLFSDVSKFDIKNLVNLILLLIENYYIKVNLINN